MGICCAAGGEMRFGDVVMEAWRGRGSRERSVLATILTSPTTLFARGQISAKTSRAPIATRMRSLATLSCSPVKTYLQADRWAMVMVAIMQMLKGVCLARRIGRVSISAIRSMARRILAVCMWASRE